MDKVTYLGGIDTAMGKQIQKSLTAAGFIVMPAPSDMAGLNPTNIVNSNLSSKGVQLEMTRGLRDSFISQTTKPSASLAKYAAALNKGIKAHIAALK